MDGVSTDSKFWFLHEESPECRYGKECKLKRCMFYHAQEENVLGVHKSGKERSLEINENSGNMELHGNEERGSSWADEMEDHRMDELNIIGLDGVNKMGDRVKI